MAKITLTGLWLTLASDQSKAMYLPYGTSLQSAPEMNLSRGSYADNSGRLIRTPGYAAKLSLNAKAVTAAQRRLLEFDATRGGWLGELICVRDYLGHRYWGYLQLPTISYHAYNDESDIPLVLEQITYYEFPQGGS